MLSCRPHSTSLGPRPFVSELPVRSRAFVTLMVLALAIAAAVWVVIRTPFTADLSAFLPASPNAEQRLLMDQLKQGVASRTLMVALEGGDAASRAAASKALAAALRQDKAYTSVNNGERGDYAAAGEVLMAHRYVLSDWVAPERFTATGLHDALQDTALRLGSPEGAPFKPLWPRDPTGEMLHVAEGLLPSQSPRSDRGVWVSRDGQRALLLLTLRAPSENTEGQAEAMATVQAQFNALSQRTAPAAPGKPALRMQMSGHGVFAIQSRDLIEREAKRLSLWGALSVALVLVLAFGTLSSVAMATLPVLLGVLAGVAAVSLAFGQVHGMTLGFGATLVGEAVDYAIYYLIQARPRPGGGPSRWWTDGWPTVRLGLLTSVCGFAALVFSGFPGLAQLGVFSIAGLVAAAMATRFVLPLLAPWGARGQGVRAALGRATAWGVRQMPRARWIFVGLTVASVAALVALPRPIWRGDLQSLSPVPQAALKVDAALREDLGASDARTLVVARGPTLDAALAAAERVGEALAPLVASGVLSGFESPARLLPSAATQRARRDALPDPDALTQALAAAQPGLPFKVSQIEAFKSDVEAARTRNPLTAKDYADTPLATALDAMTFERSDGGWAALLPLQWGAETSASPAAWHQAVEQVRLAVESVRDLTNVTNLTNVTSGHGLQAQQSAKEASQAIVLDVKQSLDSLYDHYMREALWQSGLGAAAVVLLLAVVLRNPARLGRVMVPLAMAVLITLALLALARVPLGILHLIGLLLVVAVGSNYALFFDQWDHAAGMRSLADPLEDDEQDTHASLLLANVTTVLTFALLAASDIAALSAMGMVVAPGALIALLASAAMAKPATAPYGKIRANA